MCGIFGLVGSVFDFPGREKAARTLHHRGPDGFGSFENREQQVYLAHCRLAVLDLSANGAQPMASEDGDIWIVFNGEIYGYADLRVELQALGHRFRSKSDTEVLIHAYEEWGIDCLQRLNGMFAFALWDRLGRRLHLVRDRLGIKPLYVASHGSSLAFASDTRALIVLPFLQRELEQSAVVGLLLNSYVSGRQSIWQGIQRVLPGHRIECDLTSGALVETCWWSLSERVEHCDFDQAFEAFSKHFEESVAACMVSDVPIGVFLSGGYDSSAVAKAASNYSPGIHSFSIGFRGWHRNETTTSRATASLIGSSHCEKVFGDDEPGLIDTVLQAYDEPLGDTSIFPTFIVCALARRHVTVALSGDGGDELLAGYRWHQQIVHSSTRKRLAFLVAPWLHSIGLGQTSFGKRCDPFAHYRLLTSPSFTLEQLRALLPGFSAEAFPSEEAYLYRSHYRPGLSGYKCWQALDIETYLPDSNLLKVDRASMANSLEVRVPFLDHRLFEAAFSIPNDHVARQGEPKRLLAYWLDRHGLQHLLRLPKQGFSCPMERFWPTSEMLSTVLNGELVKSGLLDRNAAARILESSKGLPLFMLAILSRWLGHWKPV